MVLQKVLGNDDFLEMYSARRLVNISGTERAIDLKLLQVKDMDLLHMHMGLWVYCSATTTMVAEMGTK
jgi:succinate dehydrogenase flavin-adding protein (antitoxin of CptAB toxin-antitoxin module)